MGRGGRISRVDCLWREEMGLRPVGNVRVKWVEGLEGGSGTIDTLISDVHWTRKKLELLQMEMISALENLDRRCADSTIASSIFCLSSYY